MSSNLERSPHPAQATYDANRLVRQEAFLEAYAKSGTIRGAAISAGIDRTTVRLWQLEDPTFPERLKDAYEDWRDYLQDSATEKVMARDPKTNLHDPRNNLLHLAMLNAHVPELYKPERPSKGENAPVTQIFINAPQSVNIQPPVAESGAETRIIDTESRPLETTDSATDTGS